MPDSAEVRSPKVFFHPQILTENLQKTCRDNDLVKSHMRILDAATEVGLQTRMTVKERQVDNPLLQSMAISNIPAISSRNTEGEISAVEEFHSFHALFPLDIVTALKSLLVTNRREHKQLMASFNAIEEYLIDQIVNVCALSQGSGDWCTFVSLRREDYDVSVSEPMDWKYLCEQADKGIKPQDVETGITTDDDNDGGDARFARIVQSLLMEFGSEAFAAFFRLQDKKYHYYRVVLPLQRYRLKAKSIIA